MSEINIAKRTQSAFIWTRVLDIPFWCLINMLTFILYKDLHITPLQITAIVIIKPMSSLLSPYWSQAIYQREDRIISNLIWANILRYLPFLFLPWFTTAWLPIIGFGIYMTLYRGTVPSWMELLKRNAPQSSRQKLVGYGSIINYGGAAVITLAIGYILDNTDISWRWLFVILSAIGLSSTLTLWRLPHFPRENVAPLPSPRFSFDLHKHVLKPWRLSWELIRQRSDFAYYQWGFMLGGAGLMIMQPALPLFFVDTLKLSYKEMGIAIAICKGLGVVATTPFWTKLFGKIDIFHFSGLVMIPATLFPILLMVAPEQLYLLYFAYLLYGVMQAGSEMSWHMSGIVFAKDKESSAFSGTNLLSVGIRGCIIPTLGATLLPLTGSVGLMWIGMFLSLIAAGYMLRQSDRRVLSAE